MFSGSLSVPPQKSVSLLLSSPLGIISVKKLVSNVIFFVCILAAISLLGTSDQFCGDSDMKEVPCKQKSFFPTENNWCSTIKCNCSVTKSSSTQQSVDRSKERNSMLLTWDADAVLNLICFLLYLIADSLLNLRHWPFSCIFWMYILLEISMQIWDSTRIWNPRTT